MKNQDEFSVLKGNGLTHDQLLNLRGGSEPGNGGCGPGFNTYVCDFMIGDDVPVHGIVCVVGTNYTAAITATYDDAYDIGCSPVSIHVG